MSLSQRTEMRRTPMPPRKTPLKARNAPNGNRKPLERVTRLRPVSRKRAALNRQRAAAIAAKYPERPRCECGRACGRLADDVHEILTRARGGSITDGRNFKALARACHDEVTFTPETELGWAYSTGLLAHSWDGPGVAA